MVNGQSSIIEEVKIVHRKSYILHRTFLHQTVLLIGIILFAASTLFSVITLPVEFDASARALKWLDSAHITTTDEHVKAKDALKWAALTYVVAALASIAMLVQYILIYQSRSRD